LDKWDSGGSGGGQEINERGGGNAFWKIEVSPAFGLEGGGNQGICEEV
jgi:hypothetical protein